MAKTIIKFTDPIDPPTSEFSEGTWEAVNNITETTDGELPKHYRNAVIAHSPGHLEIVAQTWLDANSNLISQAPSMLSVLVKIAYAFNEQNSVTLGRDYADEIQVILNKALKY